MKLFDFSSHPALCFRFVDHDGGYRRVAVMRATYAIATDGSLSLIQPQPPLNFEEKCFGAVLETAPRDESHLAPEKPNVDVVIHADAHAPGGRPAPRFDVSLAIRARKELLLAQRLVVTGPREWRYGGLIRDWRLSDPAPVASVPLRFELAYGGSLRLDDPSDGYPEPIVLHHDDNPIGKGFVPSVDQIAAQCGVGSATARTLYDHFVERNPRLTAPQIEHPDRPLARIEDRPALSGWGLVAKHWGPRYRHAGSYDDAWARSRYPLLPRDFDPRYWNCASPDLQLAELPADAEIELRGVTTNDEPLRLMLPGFEPTMTMRDVAQSGPVRHRLRLDTVMIDLYARELTLLYRKSVLETETLAWIELEETP